MVGTLRQQSVKDRQFVHGALLVKRPGYADKFLEILRIIVSQNEIYLPEKIEIGSDKGSRTVIFDPGLLKQLSLEWDKAGPVATCILKRFSPSHVEIYLGKVPLPFESIGINVEKDYFNSPDKLLHLLAILQDLYALTKPSYGYVETQEMIRRFDSQGGKVTMGINLERALPDIYWANFLGPEYVEMFGRKKLESAPCYRVETLSDGGILLLLTPSPFDYDKDPDGFERLRLSVKEHLGVEAFDIGDWHFKGKTPAFDFSDKEKTQKTPVRAEQARGFDILSAARRYEWVNLIMNTKELALQLVNEMASKGVNLDFSANGLRKLDEHIPPTTPEATYFTSFFMRVAAYVAEVVMRNLGGSWLFEENAMPTNEGLPVLKINDIYASPVVRTQKVLLEGEKFEHWYRTLIEQLKLND